MLQDVLLKHLDVCFIPPSHPLLSPLSCVVYICFVEQLNVGWEELGRGLHSIKWERVEEDGSEEVPSQECQAGLAVKIIKCPGAVEVFVHLGVW